MPGVIPYVNRTNWLCSTVWYSAWSNTILMMRKQPQRPFSLWHTADDDEKVGLLVRFGFSRLTKNSECKHHHAGAAIRLPQWRLILFMRLNHDETFSTYLAIEKKKFDHGVRTFSVIHTARIRTPQKVICSSQTIKRFDLRPPRTAHNLHKLHQLISVTAISACLIFLLNQ